MSPTLFETPDAARDWARSHVTRGGTLGFVPTMGALHDGHLALVARAVSENDAAVVSVFVNPLQFNDPGDLERYPRDLAGDVARLAEVGCHAVFTGTLDEFFPGQVVDGRLAPERWVEPGPGAEGLEGEHRPGHFEGVATIVDRLFEVVEPTRGYFGQKDFQQCLVVEHVAHLRGGPQVVVCPTVRERDGLAMSSRNLLLTDEGRRAGLAISAGLAAARAAWRGGERDPRALEAAIGEALAGAPLVVEYAAVRDPRAWSGQPARGPLEAAVGLVAAQAEGQQGPVRLIDNLALDGEAEVGPWGS